MARWKSQGRAERGQLGFSDLWVDLCWCPACAEYVFHVEVAAEAVRDGYVSHCPDCGSRLEVLERDNRGVRLH